MRVYTSVYDRDKGSDLYILSAVRHFFGDDVGYCRIDGAPQIIPSGSRYISVTHTNTYFAVALSDKPIGIDAEMIDTSRNYRAIAKKMGWGDSCSCEEFYLKWTEYEARFKADTCESVTVRYYNVFKNAITALVSVDDSIAEFYPLEQILTI